MNSHQLLIKGKEKKSIEDGQTEVEVDGRTIWGYFATWELDRVGDTIDEKAFKKTLTERGPRREKSGRVRSKIKTDFNHECIVGVPVEMYADSKGAFYKAVIDETPKGDEVLTRVKSGSLDMNSFIYDVLDYEPVNSKNHRRHLTELKVYFAGPVDDPANETAEILGFKNFLEVSGWEGLLRDVKAGHKLAQQELAQLLKAQKAISELIALAGANPTGSAPSTESLQSSTGCTDIEAKSLLETLQAFTAELKGSRNNG